MKTLTNSLFAAVALVAAAGTISAQTRLTAEVPFAFRVNGTLMAPGSYTIGNTSNNILKLRNESEHKTAVVLGHVGDASREWQKAGVPKIGFECYDGECSLVKVWTGDGRDEMRLPAHRLAMRNNARLEIITVALKAE